jgi:hypothetical protein
MKVGHSPTLRIIARMIGRSTLLLTFRMGHAASTNSLRNQTYSAAGMVVQL